MSDLQTVPRKPLTLRLESDTIQLLMDTAIQSRITVSDLITQLAKDHLPVENQVFSMRGHLNEGCYATMSAN